ncbi:MAG: type I-C CRISPR-associated protein Cas7/Csd2 [Lachnospiraceae bacterium]|nr:type I-C CRISPR-associated protein Cas7/Csd2 [Lachnospiraceae bacterium]
MSIKNRYEFVMLFDVENGNPNGDPDAGNSPRVDVETGYGYITDVCLKRKIRNYVELVKDGVPKFNILIKNDSSLNSKFKKAYNELGIKSDEGNEHNKEEKQKALQYMCNNYYDVRTFGAVMSTGNNNEKESRIGIIRGPVQINFARSISPINIEEISITRQAKTTDMRQEQSGNSEMARKSIIPYALYRSEGYISAALASKVTGFSDEDLELLWEAIINMFEHDHSAARGKMCMRKLIVFRHENILGNAPSHVLFDKIQIQQKKEQPPRNYNDYDIIIDKNMPSGVEIIEKI